TETATVGADQTTPLAMPYAANSRATASRLRDAQNEGVTVPELQHLQDDGGFDEGEGLSNPASGGYDSDGQGNAQGDQEEEETQKGEQGEQQGEGTQGPMLVPQQPQQQQQLQNGDQQRMIIAQHQQQILMMQHQQQQQQLGGTQSYGASLDGQMAMQQQLNATAAAAVRGFDRQQQQQQVPSAGMTYSEGARGSLPHHHHQQQQQHHHHGGAGPGFGTIDPSTTAESEKARQTEGSWQCEQCGNINYANRLFCNMHKCQ
ncbi:hypothetical protein FOZ63_015985, partial [Perkinsus olseni]